MKQKTLKELLEHRRAILLQSKPIKDHYVESIKVDFVKVLDRHLRGKK